MIFMKCMKNSRRKAQSFAFLAREICKNSLENIKNFEFFACEICEIRVKTSKISHFSHAKYVKFAQKGLIFHIFRGVKWCELKAEWLKHPFFRL